uniref:Amino acid transporter n=1 Tax=Acanthochromis polyacanthus TaxID=80966 RepID=A0A3Q1FDA0_9TELE
MAVALDEVWGRVKNVCKQNGLLILSVLAVVIGCLLGFFLRGKQLSEQEVKYFQFPGELLMRMLKMLILPLVVSSNMFPANLVQATFQQVKLIPKPTVAQLLDETTTRRVYIYGIQDDNGTDVQNFSLDLTPPPDVIMKTSPGTSEGMNVLGIVIFSATMGECFGPTTEECTHMNGIIAELYFPFGIVFLVAGKILEMDDPSAMGKKLGFYAITVVMGLVLHGLFILPAMYFFITKKSPIVYIRGILQALLISLATSSSSATLPITFKCLLENNHIDRRIIRFVLPVGATINMDGTALYEAVAAIFIAQVNNYELDFGQIITISITATAASIGAAGIPQAGLVTMVIVLTSVGLPTDDITLIIAVDWALDRFRTMVNVMGDALATGIMAHICRKDFVKEGEQVRAFKAKSMDSDADDDLPEPEERLLPAASTGQQTGPHLPGCGPPDPARGGHSTNREEEARSLFSSQERAQGQGPLFH